MGKCDLWCFFSLLSQQLPLNVRVRWNSLRSYYLFSLTLGCSCGLFIFCGGSCFVCANIQPSWILRVYLHCFHKHNCFPNNVYNYYTPTLYTVHKHTLHTHTMHSTHPHCAQLLYNTQTHYTRTLCTHYTTIHTSAHTLHIYCTVHTRALHTLYSNTHTHTNWGWFAWWNA